MPLPGFTAQTSLYRAICHYLARGAVFRANAAGQGVTPAYPCACSDPNCQNPITTCTCDCQPSPCDNLTGCAKARCQCLQAEGTLLRCHPKIRAPGWCECNGALPVPILIPCDKVPCGFFCM